MQRQGKNTKQPWTGSLRTNLILSSYLSVCDHMDLDMPQVDEESTIRFEGESKEKKGNQKEEETKDEIQYESEEEQDLYQGLIDLKEFVPDTLIGKKQQTQPEKDAKPIESPNKIREEEKIEKLEKSEKSDKTEEEETPKSEKIEIPTPTSTPTPTSNENSSFLRLYLTEQKSQHTRHMKTLQSSWSLARAESLLMSLPSHFVMSTMAAIARS